MCQGSRQEMRKFALRENFVRRPAEHSSRSAAKGRILERQGVENLLDLLDRQRFGLTGQGPAFHLKGCPIRIAAQLAASFDNRGVQRTGSHQRMRWSRRE